MALPTTRHGIWTYTEPFSLNAVGPDWSKSDFFQTTKINIVPMIVQFLPSGVDPSGSRHLQTASAFDQVLASGKGIARVDFPALNLDSAGIGTGSGITCTQCILFRIDQFELNTSRVHNIRMWTPDLSDFLCPHTATAVFIASGTWQQNFQFRVNALLDVEKRVPRSLPSGFNIRRQDGGRTIFGTGDEDASEYIYMALASSGSTPIGEYGGINQIEGFTLRFTYNFDNAVRFRD